MKMVQCANNIEIDCNVRDVIVMTMCDKASSKSVCYCGLMQSFPSLCNTNTHTPDVSI